MSFLQHLPCQSGDPYTSAEERWEQVFQSDKETNRDRHVRRSSYNQIFTSPLRNLQSSFSLGNNAYPRGLGGPGVAAVDPGIELFVI